MRLRPRFEAPSAAPLRAEPQDEAFDWLRVLIINLSADFEHVLKRKYVPIYFLAKPLYSEYNKIA